MSTYTPHTHTHGVGVRGGGDWSRLCKSCLLIMLLNEPGSSYFESQASQGFLRGSKERTKGIAVHVLAQGQTRQGSF